MSELYFSAVADTIFPAVFDLSGTFVEILAQAAGDAAGDGPPAGGGEVAADGDAAPPSLVESLLRNPLSLFAGLMLLFYLMVLLPERRKQAAAARRRGELKKNDRVLTNGGIYGTVVATTPGSDDITLRIDDANNTQIRIVRSAISTVLTPGKDESSG